MKVCSIKFPEKIVGLDVQWFFISIVFVWFELTVGFAEVDN